MKMKINWYAVTIATLLMLLFTACSQPVSQPEPGFFNLCDKLKQNIEQAQSIASDLEDFHWDEFANVGILYPPQGVCPVGALPIVEKSAVAEELIDRVTPLVEQLPSPEAAKIYSVQCENCLKLATELCSHSPYAESQTITPAAEKIILEQWQESCSQMQSALQGAEYSAYRDKTIAADYTIPKLLVYFNASDEKIKQQYLDKFMAKSDKYIQLHDELIHYIQQAKQAATELAGWQFSSQQPAEQ